MPLNEIKTALRRCIRRFEYENLCDLRDAYYIARPYINYIQEFDEEYSFFNIEPEFLKNIGSYIYGEARPEPSVLAEYLNILEDVQDKMPKIPSFLKKLGWCVVEDNNVSGVMIIHRIDVPMCRYHRIEYPNTSRYLRFWNSRISDYRPDTLQDLLRKFPNLIVEFPELYV